MAHEEPAPWFKPTAENPNPTQNLWSRIDLKGIKSVKSLLRYFDQKLGLEIQAINAGKAILFMSWSATPEKLAMSFPQLYESVTRVPVEPSKKWLPLTIMA